MTKVTVIISYYKAIDNLKMILKALNKQSVSSFEVIVSEDDCNKDTIDYFEKNRDLYSFSLIHIYQKEDSGFRKNAMLNRAILKANFSLLVFIDGDCIPHKHLVKEYIRNAEKGFFLSGRAVMMTESLSKEIVKKQSLSRMNFISIFFTKSKRKKEGFYFPFFPLSLKSRGLVGRNWGAFKDDLLAINGFDSDYVFAGVGEDVDVEWRLMENGIGRKSLKNKAIVFHVFHEKVYSEVNVKKNYGLFYSKKKLNNIRCLKGIETISNS